MDWDAFPYDLDELCPPEPYQPSIETSRPLLLSLPDELLFSITDHLNWRSLAPLARTSTRLYPVAISRLYETVHINGADLVSISSKDEREDEDKGQLEETVHKILQRTTGSRVLRALLSRPSHLSAVREFHINSATSPCERDFETLVSYALQHSPNLRLLHHTSISGTMELPKTWSQAFRKLVTTHMCYFVEDLVRDRPPPMLDALSLAGCMKPEEFTGGKKGYVFPVVKNLEVLVCPEESEYKEDEVVYLADAFPEVETLLLGRCTCRWQWGEKQPVKSLLEATAKLVEKLPHLRSLTLMDSEEWGHIAEDEVWLANELGKLNPALENLTFSWAPDKVWAWGQLMPCKRSSHWRRQEPSPPQSSRPAGKKLPPIIAWTPDPRDSQRWEWWFRTFGIPELALKEMARRWPITALPSERELYTGAMAFVRQALLEEEGDEEVGIEEVVVDTPRRRREADAALFLDIELDLFLS